MGDESRNDAAHDDPPSTPAHLTTIYHLTLRSSNEQVQPYSSYRTYPQRATSLIYAMPHGANLGFPLSSTPGVRTGDVKRDREQEWECGPECRGDAECVGKGPCVRRCPGHGIRGRAHGHLTDDRLALYCGAAILPRGPRGAFIVACAPAVPVLPSSLPLSGKS